MRRSLPLGLATASLDVLNTSHGARAAVHNVPSTASASAPAQDAAYAQHAQHAATCAATALARDAFVLARVLGGGTELELRIVCGGKEDNAPPVSFRLPAPVLANIGVFEDGSSIHVLAITTAAYVYRLAIPFATLLRGAPLYHGWASEHQIAALSGAEASTPTSVHAVDAGALLIACSDGAIVQLRQTHAGGDGLGYAGPWRESVMRPASLFSVSRLFSRNRATYALALATHVRENDPALAFTICADRRLRVWNLVTESCIRTIDLPPSFAAAESAARGTPQNDHEHEFGRSTPLVRVFYQNTAAPFSLYVLVFVPAPPPGGSFLVAYGVELEDGESWSGGVGEMALVWGRACDARTRAADVELRDMALSRDGDTWNAWLLWHTGGGTLLQHVPVLDSRRAGDQALVSGADDSAWATAAAPSPHLALRGPDFDAALASLRNTHDVAQFFVTRLLEPGRFSTLSLQDAFSTLVPNVAVPQDRTALVAALITHIDKNHGLQRDATSGALLYDQLFEDTVGAWLAYVRLVEQHEASARWPLRLAADGPLVVISRNSLAVLVARDAPTWLGAVATQLAGTALHPERALARAIGEMASAEYAQVVNSLTIEPDASFSVVQTGGVQRLQLAALAAEMYGSLGANGQARLENILLRLGGGPAAPQLINAIQDAPLHKLHAYITDIGADAVLAHVDALVEMYVETKTESTEFAHSALTAAAAAAAVADSAFVRVHALAALVVLTSALIQHATDAPAGVERALNRALEAWKQARAFAQLVRLGAEVHEDAAPTIHILHALILHGVVRCGLRASGSAFVPVMDIPSPYALASALVEHGFTSAVLAYLESFDTTPPVMYLRAQGLVRVGRVHEAWRLLEKVSAALAAKDKSLLQVLPESIHGVYTLWTHSAALFEAAGDVNRAAEAYARALESPGADTRETWTRLFRAQLALGKYERAARTVLAMPHDDVQMVCLQSLVTALCEADAVPTLLRLHFGELQPAAERALSFKARNAEPLSRPNYFSALYSYHVSRGDYKSAAATMYQHARRLRAAALGVPVGDGMGAELAVQQAHALLASINALSLLAPENAWFAHALGDEPPGIPPPASAPVKRALPGRLPNCIPERLFGTAAHPVAILQFADVRREYDELLTRLELVRAYPELASPTHSLKAEDAVHLFLASDDYDGAFRSASALGVDPSAVFSELAGKCVVLEQHHRARVERLFPNEDDKSKVDRESDNGNGSDSADTAVRKLQLDDEEAADPDAAFLASSRAASWSGRAHERAWRLVRLHLDAQESVAWRNCAIAAVDRVLSLDAELIPQWLYDDCRLREPDALVRAYMRNGLLEPALKLSATLVRNATSDTRTRQSQPRAYLPYTLFDSLIAAAERAGKPELGAPLREALDERVRVLQRTHAHVVPDTTNDDAPPAAALVV
ncbi:hypothetical protein MCUN1_000491 [Malassezia cuniculi]|uniref:Nuclear pore complex protein Nup160 n=1 Tax=Malassezia cuniculi TaxID=948313 RepID=A0AAF0EN87_9BASI|nr:hypothetical protein MCUN1_000491 [Malassezia cuniculi]